MMKSQHTRREKHQIAAAQLHPVAWMIRRAARKAGSAEFGAAVWLQGLNRNATEAARGAKEWPKTPNQLGRLFGELSEGLALLGVEVTFRRSCGARLWRVESAEHAASRRHLEATRPQFEAEWRAHQREENALFRSIRADARRRQRKIG